MRAPRSRASVSIGRRAICTPTGRADEFSPSIWWRSFRPFFADRLVLSMINRRQLSERDFRSLNGGAGLLTEEGRKAVLVAYQERKRDEIQHPFLEEKITVGLLWFVQAQLLARHLRGDLDAYPPFIWK